ncbi:hypothetical protein KUTeg_022066 [Tegillarca granosa]|uniref:Uncharacterized protein n=1 Tax=Tegillarca granosa TaxID=220873 RepID=A0ABQ9E5J3_TEGGR|nr:hypothetical protein KUTeg_022066 [Tegillarca granosa]
MTFMFYISLTTTDCIFESIEISCGFAGSSAGIGEGIAVHFAKIGCRLSLSGRSQEKLQAVANRCVKECGLPEGKINNAGVLNFGTVESTTEEMYDNIMGTNLKSHFFMSQLAIPHLKKVKGMF